MIRVQGLNLTYPGGLAALHDVTMDVEPGATTLVVGGNGAGKTSLLRAITGFQPAERVSVASDVLMFDDWNLAGRTPEQTCRRGVVLVPERDKVFATLTVEENLQLADAARRRGPYGYDVIHELFPVLLERRRQLAGLLSGGERQMLAIARALRCQPQVLAVDELSLGLAPAIFETLLQTLERLQAEFGTTLLLVEQGLRESLPIADSVYVLRQGQVVFGRPTSEIDDRSVLDDLYFGN